MRGYNGSPNTTASQTASVAFEEIPQRELRDRIVSFLPWNSTVVVAFEEIPQRELRENKSFQSHSGHRHRVAFEEIPQRELRGLEG